jgi:cardiolipin synthase A/B
MVSPGHRGDQNQNHDLCIELVGPCVVDVHHNFVQRWNEASEKHVSDGLWGPGSEEDLSFPKFVPEARGDAVAQIQRTMASGRITNGYSTPQGVPFDITAGERSNFEQYRSAIRAAHRSIYIEHQSITVSEIIEDLQQAVQRGVEVSMVLPAADDKIPPDLLAFADYSNCTLAGIAGIGFDGTRKPVWVHAKLMVVDNAWFTVGSCNLHHASLLGNAEMNIACWHPDTARALRRDLFLEHLSHDTCSMDDLAALRLFRRMAIENRAKLDRGEHDWRGLAFSLVPTLT